MTPDEDAELYREIGRRLRAARNATGLSLLQVEEKSRGEWRAGAVQSYECARRKPYLHTIAGLADWYGVPLSTLIPGAEGPDVAVGDVLGVLHCATELQAYCEGLRAAIEPEVLRNGSTQDREAGEGHG